MKLMLFAFLLLLPRSVHAADHAAALEKYLADDVVALAYVDLTKIDTAALLNWGELLGFSHPDERAEASRVAEEMQKRLIAWTDAGAGHV